MINKGTDKRGEEGINVTGGLGLRVPIIVCDDGIFFAGVESGLFYLDSTSSSAHS